MKIEDVLETMSKALNQSQRALDGEFGETEPLEHQTIIWFQVRIENWMRMLKEIQSSEGTVIK